MPKSKRLNIFNINSNQNFLLSLVEWVLKKYPDPLYLSNITILLPSRRACRELKKAFLSLSENGVVILPKIVAIGDVDYDEMFDGTEFEADCEKENITPTPHQNSAGVLTPPQGGSDGTEFGLSNPYSNSDGTEFEGQQLQSSAQFNHSSLIAVGGRQFIVVHLCPQQYPSVSKICLSAHQLSQ
jgi:hypothetical protein